MFVTGLMLVCLTGLVMAQNGQDLYQQGFGQEQLGDFGGAIKFYERIIREFAADRALVARAKVRLGDSLMKQGQARGLEVLNDVINNHKDQEELVASARALVSARAGWAGSNKASGGDLRIDTLFTKDPYSFAISPDGRSLVNQASVGGKNQLWLHKLDTGTQAPIGGTDGASEHSFPFWSPNGKSIGFFADGKLKRVDIAGGPATVLADAPFNRGGTWSKDDVILFVPFEGGPFYTVPAGGGPKVAITPDGAPRRQFPQFLEDGRRFIYVADTQWMVGNLDSGTSREFPALRLGSVWGVFAPPDRLFYYGQGLAMAALLNLETLERRPLAGDLSRLTGAMPGPLFDGKGPFSASAAGPIAYRKEVAIHRSLIWYDREGRRLSTFDLPLGSTRDLRLSPKGDRAIFRSSSALDHVMGKDLFLLDMKPGASPRTFSQGTAYAGGGGAWSPVWSHDGNQIALSRRQAASYDLFTQAATAIDGAGLKLWSDEVKFATDWSEGFLLYERMSPTTGADILASPLENGDPVPVAVTSAMESAGRFSPNGQWIAYQSNAEGRNEVYVQRFPGSPSSRLRVSIAGGTSPEWRHDGKELYFLSADNRLMAVSVAASDQNLVLGKPAALFTSPLPEDSTYAPAPDGRFLINAPTTGDAPPIYVVTNWTRPTAAPIDSSGPQSEIVVLDRQGNRLRSVFTPGPRTVLSLSPDGSRVSRFRPGGSQGGTMWTIDLQSSAHTQIASGGVTSAPVWAPDAKSVVYVANRGSGPSLYAMALDGVSTEKLLYAPVIARGAGNWAMEGRFILIGVGNDWSLLPTTDDSRKPVPIFPVGNFGPPRLSPNSQFVGHLSDEGGSSQVWVRRVATPEGTPVRDGMRWKVSTEGSVGMVRWRSDGNELYYLTLNGWVMAVSITTTPEFKADPPRRLFRVPPGFPMEIANSGIYADVSADGEQFVFAMPEATPPR
jgi:Tol biopolymer transport system component